MVNLADTKLDTDINEKIKIINARKNDLLKIIDDLIPNNNHDTKANTVTINTPSSLENTSLAKRFPTFIKLSESFNENIRKNLADKIMEGELTLERISNYLCEAVEQALRDEIRSYIKNIPAILDKERVVNDIMEQSVMRQYAHNTADSITSKIVNNTTALNCISDICHEQVKLDALRLAKLTAENIKNELCTKVININQHLSSHNADHADPADLDALVSSIRENIDTSKQSHTIKESRLNDVISETDKFTSQQDNIMTEAENKALTSSSPSTLSSEFITKSDNCTAKFDAHIQSKTTDILAELNASSLDLEADFTPTRSLR